METIKLENDITVMYITAASFPAGVLAAHQKLHSLIPFSTERKYFGLSRPEGGDEIVYKAAAEVLESGEAEKLNLETLTIKKGTVIDMKLNSTNSTSATAVSMLKAAFEKQFGAGNVTHDEGSGYFTVKSKKKVIARSVVGYEDWKFAVVDTENQKKILSSFIPPEILE